MTKTKWYQKPAYLLFALVLVLSLGIAALPMAGTVGAATPIYVNASTGDDSWDGESAVWDGVHGPKKTIKAGIGAVDAPGTVHVAAGTYSENNIGLKDGVEVLGAGADVTTIDGGGGGSVVYGNNVGSTTKLDSFNISNGSAVNGGGIHLETSCPTISNCIFTGNSATQDGGGIYNYYSSPTVTNCIFTGNSAGWGGGMFDLQVSSPNVTNCIFTGNSATSDGGGMFNSYNCSPTVTNCRFSGNSATYFGGGMYNGYNSPPTVTDCIFSGNSATDAGGGMYNFDSLPTVSNCIFQGNSAVLWNGGGMYNFDSSPTVTNCRLSGNSAPYGGGMYSSCNCSPTVTNCIFSDNSADYGGGMENADHSSPTVTNCIFSGNSATDAGGGMYNYIYSSPTVTNCIFSDNGDEIYNADSSTPVVTCCDIQGGYPGVGNINADPLFVEPAAHDYKSKPGSPCIDAGTNVGAPIEDIEGNPRPIDGDGDGWAITDMGAYEYMPPTPPAHFKYLHSEGGLFNITYPVGTQWHELWPFFCKEYHLSGWEDNGDGILSYCDTIDMYEKPDGELRDYHVETVTITLVVTPAPARNTTDTITLPPPQGNKLPLQRMYIELEGGYNATVLDNPEGTQWHEIYPVFCTAYNLTGWMDNDSETLDWCDGILLVDKETGEEGWWHVEEVAIDIVVTPEPPPVGGEAYPVSKASVLAPWIAVGLVGAGGASWYVLRRRRAQS